jgi:hypothetical protein
MASTFPLHKRLAPAPGIRDKSLYANLAVVQPMLKTAVARRAAAVSEASAEARLKRKVEQANTVLNELEKREAAFGAQIKELQRRKNALAGRIEKIEDRALTLMQDAGLATVAGIRCSFRAQPAAPSLVVDDQSLIPAEYLRQPKTPPPEPDKLAIKAALAKNDELDPAAWGVRLSSKISLIRT